MFIIMPELIQTIPFGPYEIGASTEWLNSLEMTRV